jgi:hypothetical protein
VSTRRRDLLKQGAHVLGVACCEHPTRVVGQKLEVANGGHTLTLHRIALILNGEQGDGGAVEDQQVALTELHEGLMGSPLQSVIEVVAKPSWSGQWGELECAHGPCSAQAQTDGTGNHGTRESPHSQSGVAHLRARWENRGGPTRHNRTIRRL